MPSYISSCYLNNAFENTEYDWHNMSDCDANDRIFFSENKRYNCPISGCVQSNSILDCVHGQKLVGYEIGSHPEYHYENVFIN